MWISGGEDARVKLCFLVMDCASRRPQSWRSAGNQCSHHGGRDRVSVWGGLKFSEKMTERSAKMCYSFSSEIKRVFLFQVC